MVPFALMSAAIGGIIIFLIMLIVGPLLTIGLQGAALAVSTAGNTIPGLSSIGALGIVGLLFMVIGVPIAMFILIFIATAITAFFYNILAPKIGGVRLNFGNAVEKLFEIESIPVVPFALILTLVIVLFNLVIQLITLIGSVAVGSSLTTQLIALVVNVVINLILVFIIYALTAIIYKYLRPKIGGIKLEIE